MLDKLVLRCWFRDPEAVNIRELGIPLSGSVEPDSGEVFNLRHPWESIPSSFHSLAFKFWDFCADRPDSQPYVEIKASPAKLIHGHNVYGSDDLIECSFALFTLFYETYPQLVELLDISSWELAEVDITYASWAETPRAARQFIAALQNVSHGQTKGRGQYDGTCYFGKKNSRLRKVKVYDKFHEVLQYIAKHKNAKVNPASFFPDELMAWMQGMIRWEVTVKSRWFERHNIPTKLVELKKIFNPRQYWELVTKPIFQSLEGETMQVYSDDDILKSLREKFQVVSPKTGKVSYVRPDGAYRMYRAIRADGFIETKNTISKSAFYRNIDMLSQCGISKARLQNMQGAGQGAEIIPIVRYAVVDFNRQVPHFAPRFHNADILPFQKKAA